MRTQHTPGPWEYIPGEEPAFLPRVQRGIEGEFVVMGLSRYREEADARLIAAAPDLLEALQDALCALECCGKDYPAASKARAAIAKATGEAK